MNLILTMAGLYSRFRKEGYLKPKYLLKIGEVSILELIIKEFVSDYKFENIVLVANNRDIGFKSEIKDVLIKYDLTEKNIFFIDDTIGQAQTAFIGVNILKDNYNIKSKKVIFHNIDTLLYNRDFHNIDTALDKVDGYIDVFESLSDKFSYVELDEEKNVINMKEKIVISNLATSGMYCFSDFDIFIEYYNKSTYTNEYYISNIYKKMLDDKKIIKINKFYTSDSTVILGTPIEYEDYKKNYDKKNI